MIGDAIDGCPDDGERDGEADADEPVDTDAAAAADEAVDADPATPTATWTADGAACDRCGERVERRWSADGDLVCADCKEW
jgi:formylmethanofuran dehydrogenase subunit E